MVYKTISLPTDRESDYVAKPGIKPHRGCEWIGARDAERILGISRAACLRLVKIGQLPSKLIDEPGRKRSYLIELSAVFRLRDAGTALRCAPRLCRVRMAWVRLFGPIPEGFTVRPRDGDNANVQPENLAMVPLRGTLRAALPRRRKAPSTIRWTAEMRGILRREFAVRPTEELAREFGCSALAVRAQASRMKIRKSIEYISQRMRSARSLPLGTERRYTSEKMKGMVMLKVSDHGKQSEQWRPKQHVIWEHATGRKVPPGFRVIFKDGNRQNFEPSNLELATRAEIFVGVMARFLSSPPPIRNAVRLNRKLQREIRRQTDNGLDPPSSKELTRVSRKGQPIRRWTPEMVETLRRDYPAKPLPEIAAAIGMSISQMRVKATRLGVHREPEAMLAHAVAAAAIAKRQALGQ